MAEIAVDGEQPKARVLAQGTGWTVSDVVCTAGPASRPFEERHSRPAIAIVLAGTFQYRSGKGRALMTPGALLLGNTGQCFECGHEHGTGDRCLSFSFTPEYFDRLVFDAAAGGATTGFRALRIPPLRDLSSLIASAAASLDGQPEISWEEFGIRLAAHAAQLDRGTGPKPVSGHAGAVARVTRVVRRMEAHPEESHDLAALSSEARLSPYHFLRTFESLTGVTPHQYLLRMRLRKTAIRIRTQAAKILDIALDCGFGDVSNFNRMFRAEFGVSPRQWKNSNRAATNALPGGLSSF